MPPRIYLFVVYIFVLFFFTGVTLYRNRMKDSLEGLKKSKFLYLAAGVLALLAVFWTFKAFSLGKAGKVLPVMRLEVLLSVIFGGYLFQEKGILRRAIGSILIIGGIAIVML